MLILSALYLLLSNSVTFTKKISIYNNRNLMIILINAFILSIASLNIGLDKGISLYGGLYNITPLGNAFHIFIFFVSFFILILTSFYPKSIVHVDYYYKNISFLVNFKERVFSHYSIEDTLNTKNNQFNITEYALILLFIIIGTVFLISSSDIVSIFLSIELQSYGLYLLSTIFRNSELSTSAGLTYFLLGALSSCFILLGIGLIYLNSGITNLESLYIMSNMSDNVNLTNVYWYDPNYISYSLLIMSIGFLFKVSAAPFHFWSPDVYDAIPTVVTTFVAIIAKISLFVFLFELINYTYNYNYGFNWIIIFSFSSVLSLIIGTILGLNQYRIKRLLAYSTISHVGFLLLSLSIGSLESAQAFIFYLIQYTISNLNIFMILIAIGYTTYGPFFKKYVINVKQEKKIIRYLIDKNNSPIQYTNQLKGYFKENPILAISLAFTIYSLVGIPPLMGFFGKQMVLSAALDKGYIFITIIAILTSVISAVYYLNIIKQIFFESCDETYYTLFKISLDIYNTPVEKKTGIVHITISTGISIAISIMTLIITLFIISPEELLSIVNLLALLTTNC